MKIIADQQIPFVREAFSRFGDVVVLDGRAISPEHVRDADILLVRSVTKVDAGLLDNSQAHFVGSATSGIDHVDVDYLNEQGIDFAYAPGSNARSVAEYILSSLFVLAEQRAFSLMEKTVAIIGCGHVGSCVHEFAQALGMRCFINAPPLKDRTGSSMYCDLDEALSADIVTIHVPLTDNGDYPTRSMVNADFLAQLKPGAIVINTSRGEVADETALKQFINNNGISVVSDVWSNEPCIDTDLLARVVIGTPHIAGHSLDGKLSAMKMLFNQACRHFNVTEEPVPAPEIPAAGLNRIKLDADDDTIQLAILAGYDVRSDAASLRRMLEVNEEERGDYFDVLRNNYPVRREFKATEIHFSKDRQDIREILVKLGFTVNI